jgi:hypothetical protein
MPYVGFEHTIPASKRAKTVHALVRSAKVTGSPEYHCDQNDLTISRLSQTDLIYKLQENQRSLKFLQTHSKTRLERLITRSKNRGTAHCV